MLLFKISAMSFLFVSIRQCLYIFFMELWAAAKVLKGIIVYVHILTNNFHVRKQTKSTFQILCRFINATDTQIHKFLCDWQVRLFDGRWHGGKSIAYIAGYKTMKLKGKKITNLIRKIKNWPLIVIIRHFRMSSSFSMRRLFEDIIHSRIKIDQF